MNHLSDLRVGPRRWAPLLVMALLSLGCDESAPTVPNLSGGPGSPEAPLPANTVKIGCVVDVREGSVACATTSPDASGVDPLILGGQDLNVLLTGTETSYDENTGKFSSTVTVQNLTSQVMGTSDGETVEGIKVFFNSDPIVVSGTGSVAVANADGIEVFVATEQSYFAYPGLIEPLEISAGRRWEFDVPATVDVFTFTVYVSAPMVAAPAELHGPIWIGAASDDWHDPANWDRGVVPQAGTSATIPSLAKLAPEASQPRLSAAGTVLHLRVGSGSELALDGRKLTVTGNVEALGRLSGGRLSLEGDDILIGGELPTVVVAGDATLQRATTATGPVTVTGSLTIADKPLTIVVQ